MTAEELAALHAAAAGPDQPWSANAFARLLGQPTSILVTEPGTFALARLVLDEAELLLIATHPAARRRGQAARVLAEVATRLGQRGARRLFLEVAEDNEAARALYAQAGFGQIAARRGYYARKGVPAVNALILSRALSAGGLADGPWRDNT